MRNKIAIVSLVAGLVVWTIGNIYSEPVESGFGKIKLNGLLQFWYQNDNSATPKDTFRLRRAEIKLSGEINPVASCAVMIDPAQVREDDVTKKQQGEITSVGRKSPLQDFVISLKPHKCCLILDNLKSRLVWKGLRVQQNLTL